MITGQLPQRPAPKQQGGGPPKDADPSEVWAKLSQLPRPLSSPHTLVCKGQEVGTVVFRVLSSGELSSVYVNAHRATKEAFGDEDAKGTVAFEEVYSDQKALHLIQLACRQPDAPAFPVFLNVKDVREHLTDDEAAVLLAAYNIFRRESGPILSELSIEDADAIESILAKTGNRFALARYNSEAMADLVMHLVSKLHPPIVAQEEADATA